MTIGGDGDVFFYSFFSVMLSENRPREQSVRRRFCHRQLRELYEADFHKPRIDGSGRVWANAWDVFPRMPVSVGHGRRAAVDLVVCFGWGGFFLYVVFSFEMHTACCKQEAILPHLSLS